MSALIFLASIYMFFFNFNLETSWPQWAYVSCLAVIASGYYFRGPIIFRALWTWIMLNAVIFSQWRPATEFVDVSEKFSVRILAGAAAVPFLLLTYLFALHFNKIRKPLGHGLFVGGMAHAVYLIFDQLILRNASGISAIGLMGNRSLGASFTCAWIFFILSFYGLRYFFPLAIGIFAVLISQSGISYLALLLGFAAYAFSIRPKLFPWIVGLFLIASPLVVFLKPSVLDHISRFNAWPMFFEYWQDTANNFLGWGAGSFSFYGPKTQLVYDFMIERNGDSVTGRWWTWAHNDWLQILFELGIIGFALSVLAYLKLLKMSWRRPALFGAAISFGAIMFGNYPWHAAPTSILGLWLIFEIINKGERQVEKN